jgi:PAS domain S-box-containing protein
MPVSDPPRDPPAPSVAVAAFTTDADGTVNSWSAEAEELLGWTVDAAIGKQVPTLLAEASPTATGGPVVGGAVHEPRGQWYRRRDGSVFEARHLVVRLSNGDGIAGHAHVLATIAPGEGSGDPELRYSEEARVRLLRRLVIAQEEERRRIARDLHDHLGQQLTSLRLKIESIRNMTAGMAVVQAALAHFDTMLLQIDNDIDFLSWELRPAALDDLGLRAVLENYVREWSRHAGVPAQFHAEGLADERVAPEVEATLYRIAQEALNNVARHAGARSVAVVLERLGRTLSLVVEDDGIGFDPAKGSPKMVGLLGMRERAAVVGGSLDIETTTGGGTTVLARVPLYLTNATLPPDAVARPPSLQDNGAIEERTGASSSIASRRVPNRVQELQRAVAARDEFIATVAHELRNPLAPLMFQVRLSMDKAAHMERAGEAVPAEWAVAQLRRIEQRLHRLLDTLDRLLDVSRLSTGRIDLELDNVDLVEAIRDVLASFEAELAVARCDVRLATPAVLTGWWDRLRVDQICRNLVSNAIRFGAGRPIDVTVEADEREAALTVRDYGIGIPPDKQDLIFERFERGTEANRSGGFGIGLWVVRNVCTALGGSITVDSAVGVGATFVVRLPRRPERDQRHEVNE